MQPLVRWTIGPVQPDGFRCLQTSIEKLLNLYDVEPVICHNDLSQDQLYDLSKLNVRLIDQSVDLPDTEKPIGVTWKLYPPRLDINRHELFIDNDLILEDHIRELDEFFTGDLTLLLEGQARHYGRFERHVPPNYKINSGLFGIPPGFDLGKHMMFFGTKWEQNAHTFDEQGLVATSLLNYPRFCIIPSATITNCENGFKRGAGMHFIGLNRTVFHVPYRQYCCERIKFYL